MKPLLGPIRVLRVGRTHTVADLKQALCDSDGIPIEAQRLVRNLCAHDHVELLLLDFSEPSDVSVERCMSPLI